jgi:6-phosphogluconolactonase
MNTRKIVVIGLLLSLVCGWVRADSGRRAVFTSTNSTEGNRVLVFEREGSGMLRPSGSFPTGGFGTGSGLGNQGAIALSERERWLLVVNAASNELSAFAVDGEKLVLTDVVNSGGVRPISVTIEHNLVYVVHAGGAAGDADSIAGFFLTSAGRLTPIPGSKRALSAANVGPAQISFAPSGDHLVVTEKNTNRIVVFPVDAQGVAGNPVIKASAGMTPFGFAFTPDAKLVVSEAAGGAPNASTMSSYVISSGGQLDTVTAALATTETAACWVAVARNGRYAYATNTGSNTVTGLRVANNGALTLMQPNGVTATTGASPIDIAVTDDNRFVYVLNGKGNSISQFRLEGDGDLVALGVLDGIPAGATGLMAR